MSYPLTSFGFKPRFLTETLSLFGYQVSQLWSVIIPNKPGSETHYNDQWTIMYIHFSIISKYVW